MNEQPSSSSESRSSFTASAREVSILDLVLALVRGRRLVVRSTLTGLALGLLLALVLPNRYEATATLTTREQESGGLGSALAASGMAQSLVGIELPSATPNRDLVLFFLESRTIAEAVAKEFDLDEHYGTSNLEATVVELREHVQVGLSLEGLISVVVRDGDPELAARIANFFVAELDQMLAQSKMSTAARERVFISDRLTETSAELEKAEDALREFQEKHKLLGMDEEVRGGAETLRFLQLDIVQLEAQIEALKEGVTETNPAFRELRRLLEAKRRQLEAFQFGERDVTADTGGATKGGADSDTGSTVDERTMHVPMAELPSLGLKLTRLKRDVLLKNEVYALLVREIERAKITEARDTPAVQIIDAAVPPVRRSSPSLVLSTVVGTATGLFLGVLIALLREFLKPLRRQWEAMQGSSARPQAGADSPSTNISAREDTDRSRAEPVV